MEQIKRKIVFEIMGDTSKQKAVAFALLLKHISNDSSVFRKFTYNRLHTLTKMHVSTIKKYVSVLKEMGLVVINNGDLYIKKMASSTKHKNINIGKFKFKNNKDTYHQVRDLIVLFVQSHKEFVRSLLQLRKNPRNMDFKKVRGLCRKYSRHIDYREEGLSYGKIAKIVGCCTRTAFNIVADAVNRRWLKKKNNCLVVFMPNVCGREVDGFTFTTRNYGYLFRANTYGLSKGWRGLVGLNNCL